MGFSHSTYHFYGVHVPEEKYQTEHQFREIDWLDAVIRHTPGLDGIRLGHITAGDYDADELFLCAVPENADVEVALGTWAVATPESHRPEWDDQLKLLAEAAGYGDIGAPGWIVVRDCS